MENPIQTVRINDHITALTAEGQCVSYVVEGGLRAAVIDTFYTQEADFGAAVREITQLPLVVLNTHGHGDHTGGNLYFDRVYLNERDQRMLRRYFDNPHVKKMIEAHKLTPCEVVSLKEGDVFDLGGVTLEVMETPAHTPGGVCFLDREDRILFTGDTVLDMIWMQLPDSLPILKLVETMKSVRARKGEYDFLLTGHWQWRTRGLTDPSLVEELLLGARELAAGQTEADVPYEWFGGTSKAHFYSKERRIIYN